MDRDDGGMADPNVLTMGAYCRPSPNGVNSQSSRSVRLALKCRHRHVTSMSASRNINAAGER